MKLGDGTQFTVTGNEAKKAVGTFMQVMYDHAKIAEVLRLSRQIKKDTTYLVRAVPDDVREIIEEVHLTGTRREQFERVRALVKKHSEWTLYRAAREAFKEIQGEGGYPSIDSLHRYCLDHPNMFE